MTNCFHGGNELHDIPLHVIQLNQDDPKKRTSRKSARYGDCVLHNDMKKLGEHHYQALNEYCNNMGRSNYWYSYMEDECIFEWHTDGDTGFRYHHVLENDPTVSAIDTDAGPIMCDPGEAFILNTVRPHQVPYTHFKRLHLVGSIHGLQSTGDTHNNQWLEDGSFDWSDWQKKHGY